MTLQSMTGFGDAHGAITLDNGRELAWRWEIKSVNGRSLDLRFRLPQGFDGIENVIRPAAQPLLRGSVQAALTVEVSGDRTVLAVDDAVLAALASAAHRVAAAIPCDPPRLDGLLSVRGLLVAADDTLSVDEKARAEGQLVAGFASAIDGLLARRGEEGARLQSALGTILTDVAGQLASARAMADVATAHHRDVLRAQIADLLQGAAVSEERVVQEAALLATKSDIREELDRLDGHLKAASDSLTAGGAVGRSLDFIAQEMMREANTLTVKVPTLTLKQIGLAVKGLVDQFKEQVQNVA